MTRTYIAGIDTGTDFIEFLYESEHRNGSHANMADARKTMIRRYGNHVRNYKIVTTCLVEQ